MNPVGALRTLLLDVFSDTQQLQQWVTATPTLSEIRHEVAWGNALGAVTFDVVTKADTRLLWNAESFSALREIAPRHDAIIQEVARQFGVWAIIPDPTLAEGVKFRAKTGPGFPGTPDNLRKLAQAAAVPIPPDQSFLPFDRILREANAREATAENVGHMRALLVELARITGDDVRSQNNQLGRAFLALTSGLVDPDDARVKHYEEVEAVLDDEAGFLPYLYLKRGADAGRAVCRVVTPRIFGTRRAERASKGTGWMITDELLVTNHHVVNARTNTEPDATAEDLAAQVQGTVVQFDVDDQEAAIPDALAALTHPDQAPAGVKVAELICWSRRRARGQSGGLDFAILRLAEKQDATRKPSPLRRDPVALETAVNIIQHPKAGPKRVALRANQLKVESDDNLRYTTNTDEGSSGSPLFDDEWSIMGLHRATDAEGGVRLNVGTPIHRILAALRDSHVDGGDATVAWNEIAHWHGLLDLPA